MSVRRVQWITCLFWRLPSVPAPQRCQPVLQYWLQLVATKNRLVLLESEAATEPCVVANLSCVGSDGFGERSLHLWSWLSNAECVKAFSVSEAEERPGHCYPPFFFFTISCDSKCSSDWCCINCACLITWLSLENFQRLLFNSCANKTIESFAFFTVLGKTVA